MNGAFQIGATGLNAQQRALEVVANNITNMNTPGFKRSDVRFSELVAPAPAAGEPGSTLADGGMLGVSGNPSQRLFLPGELRATGNPLDVAIGGAGFIELLGRDGETMLWRGGTLSVNEEGYLAGANGLTLKATISVPDGASALAIDPSGEVTATVAGETEPVSIGRIDLVTVREPGALADIDGGLYRAASDDDVVAVTPGEEGGRFVQGSLELSNVELSQEMVTLMMMQRAYAASAQVVQAGDQLMSIVNGLKR